MKTRLVPVYFDPGRDSGFDDQVNTLRNLLAEEAEILAPVALGDPIPDAEAVVFPQMLGEAYRRLGDFKQIGLPLLIVTSEFGTISMWDWEIASYLRTEGVETIAPCNLEQAKKVCRGFGVKSDLRQTRFLVFQDKPAESGFQDSIFKRFYWWEDECVQRMTDKFGFTLVKKSFEELGARAKQLPDEEAEAAWKEWQSKLNVSSELSKRALYSAIKVYIAVKQEVEKDESIKAVGINCLNESHFSDATPCLA